MKNFIIGIALTLLVSNWLTPHKADASSYAAAYAVEKLMYSLTAELRSQNRASWQQVYWLKRQAQALEVYSDCGETVD